MCLLSEDWSWHRWDLIRDWNNRVTDFRKTLIMAWLIFMINTLVSNGKQHMWVPNLQYKHECFADDTPLMHNYIRDSSGVFSISSLVKISMISLIPNLSLKFHFNCVKRRHQYVYIIKRTLYVSHSNLKFISSPHRAISSNIFYLHCG